MDLSAMLSEVAHLVGRIHQQADDRHELYLELHERLNEMRAFQMPIPQDLLDLEGALQEEIGMPADAPLADEADQLTDDAPRKPDAST